MNKMNNLTLGRLDKFIVHFVGNKTNGNGVQFSNFLTQCEGIEVHIKNLLKFPTPNKEGGK